MEQHPVPQNVTTFQFRLVGDMTLKQFGYLAGGVILAYVATKLPLPFFFTWPLTIFFALTGFGLAFVPVEERPMDIWIASFLRNTYSPTQYLWQKVAQEKPAAAPKVKTPSILSRLYTTRAPRATDAPTTSQAPAQSLSVSTQRAHDPFAWLRSLLAPLSSVKPHLSYPDAFNSLKPPPLVRPGPIAPPPASAAPPKPPFATPTPPPPAHPAVSAPEQVARLSLQQQQLAQELARVKPQLTTPPPSPSPTTTAQPTVRAIGVEAALAAGLPRLTTFPNIVTGIVKDDRGNLLPGALVTVRDRQGIPLRALKTNKLGQFSASTPLPNGTYLVEVEDPRGRYNFDRAQITVSGTILLALEVVAKTQKQIEREKLAKAIFGSQI